MNGMLNQIARRVSLAFAHQAADDRSPGAGVPQIDFLHHAANALQLIAFQMSDAPQIGQILIIARKVKQHIGRGA